MPGRGFAGAGFGQAEPSSAFPTPGRLHPLAAAGLDGEGVRQGDRRGREEDEDDDAESKGRGGVTWPSILFANGFVRTPAEYRWPRAAASSGAHPGSRRGPGAQFSAPTVE
jgi:hypothetical protein